MLTTLTQEQETLCDEIVAEYVSSTLNYRDPDSAIILRWLKIAYKLYDLEVPGQIEVAKSPYAALELASKLTDTKETELDWCGIGDSGWISALDYYNRIGVLSEEESEEVCAVRDFGRVVWDTVLLDKCAIIVCKPASILTDSDGNLHGAGVPCIVWQDGEKDYAHHGTWIPEKMAIAPRSYSESEYLEIVNTEVRRALSEINGWEWVAQILGATVSDTWVDPVTELKYELLTCKAGKLLRKQSPVLKNGTQPIYLEPVDAALSTAQAARKWQATDMLASECEKDPVLTYRTEY
jgi:hypothetical protein